MGVQVSCCSEEGDFVSRTKTYLHKNFGQGFAEAMLKVAELLARADMAINSGRSTQSPVLISLAMILKQVEDEKRYALPLTSGQKFTDRKVLRKAARHARFASIEGLDSKVAIATYLGNMQAEDIRLLHAAQSVRCPGYFAAVDPVSDEIVLCIQGGTTTAEALDEVACQPEAFMGGNAHAGMLDGAFYVAEGAKDVLVRLSLEFPRKGVAIVGHGLGAGMAALATMLLSREGCALSCAMRAGRVKCYSFAPPPTFEPLWALPAWVRGSTYSFVHGMDCVPRACLGAVSQLFMAVKQVDALPMTALQRLAFLRGDLDMDQRLPDFSELPALLERSLGSFSVIGTIILFYKGQDGQFRSEMMTPEITGRLLLHRDMVTDHTPANYEQAACEASRTN